MMYFLKCKGGNVSIFQKLVYGPLGFYFFTFIVLNIIYCMGITSAKNFFELRFSYNFEREKNTPH